MKREFQPTVRRRKNKTKKSIDQLIDRMLYLRHIFIYLSSGHNSKDRLVLSQRFNCLPIVDVVKTGKPVYRLTVCSSINSSLAASGITS